MLEFWNIHKTAILYAITVILSVFVLRYFSRLLYQFAEKKLNKNFVKNKPKNINLAEKILDSLWIVLGIIALAFIFIEKKQYDALEGNFYLIFYLGIVAVLTLVASSLVQTWFKSTIKSKISALEDPTSYKFLRYIAVLGVYFIGVLLAIMAFPSLRGIAQTALGGAGVIAVIAGVASQEALANLVGGLFIIFFKPFKIKDIIKVDETMVGEVTDITLRHTVIRNYENKMIVIPNSVINKEKIINYDLGDKMCCQWIEIGISYDSEIELAKNIMREECEDHPNLVDHRSPLQKYSNDKKVAVRVISLEDSSVLLRAWAWASNFQDAFEMKCDLLESIKNRFDKEGVSIPFPHRTMVFSEKQLQQLKTNNNLQTTNE